MSGRPRAPMLAGFLAELAAADQSVKCELAQTLGPYLDVGAGGRLLGAREMSEVTGLHPQTLVRFARSGRIWATKAGREWRFCADRAEVRPLQPTPATAALAEHSSRGGPRSLSMPASVSAIRGKQAATR